MRVLNNSKEIAAAAGEELGVSEWVSVEQQRIDQFADATGDHQWIHIDPVRAAAGPFKTTVAHGFLTLSLLPEMSASAFEVRDTRMGVNYGLNRVRFVSPVPSGSRIRARITLQAIEAVSEGFQATWLATIEREGGEKPAAVAEWLVRYYPE